MSQRQAILLSTYRLPTESTHDLGPEEAAAYLNGFTALWHPAALAVCDGLPVVPTPHDYEEPSGDYLFAIPDNPSGGSDPAAEVADGWVARARSAGAIVFEATADREQTLRNLFAALAGAHGEDERIR